MANDLDVKDENLVYVPLCRESTLERLLAEGYTIRGRVSFTDTFGTKAIMIGMAKKI